MQEKTLSKTELQIMKAIWNIDKKTTVREVLEIMYPNGEKAYTTIQTTMNILVDKKFLKKEKIGMVNFYSVKQNKSNSILNETKSFVMRVYDGSFISLANFLVKSGSLSKNEIDDLKNMINKLEEEKND